MQVMSEKKDLLMNFRYTFTTGCSTFETNQEITKKKRFQLKTKDVKSLLQLSFFRSGLFRSSEEIHLLWPEKNLCQLAYTAAGPKNALFRKRTPTMDV